MKKFLLITIAALLVLGMVLTILVQVYLPYWGDYALVRQLERSGYKVDSEEAVYRDPPPFSEHIPDKFHQVPRLVNIYKDSDRSLLPRIAANTNIWAVLCDLNLSAEELNHFHQTSIEYMSFSGAQDPAPYLASKLSESLPEFDLYSTETSPLAPEWMAQWMTAEHNFNLLNIVGDEQLRPVLPDIFNRGSDVEVGPRHLVLQMKLTKEELQSLNGKFPRINFILSGVHPSWIPESCSIDLVGFYGDTFGQEELDVLLDGRFKEIRLDTCTQADIDRFQAKGVRLMARKVSKTGDDQQP